MITKHTEYGTFSVSIVGDRREIRLDSILVGYLTSSWIDSDTNTTISIVLSKMIEVYLTILRFESKASMFVQTPTSNAFKDAVLRMQIENQGQTLEIRKYVDDDFLPERQWITYPEKVEHFDLSLYLAETMVLSTPYGLYRFVSIDTEIFRVIKTQGGTDKIVSDIKVPYSIRSYLPLDIELVAFNQAVHSIKSDVLDQINIKTNELSKRFAESVKYLFGYDKLRRAIRKRGVS